MHWFLLCVPSVDPAKSQHSIKVVVAIRGTDSVYIIVHIATQEKSLYWNMNSLSDSFNMFALLLPYYCSCPWKIDFYPVAIHLLKAALCTFFISLLMVLFP